MTYTAPVIGLLAGVVNIADTIPSVRDTVRGSTRPHRGTWLTWSALAVVACVSQRADGASWSIVMAAAQAVLTGTIFVLSIWHGEGGLLQGIAETKRDDDFGSGILEQHALASWRGGLPQQAGRPPPKISIPP